jgi:hypothetical protein
MRTTMRTMRRMTRMMMTTSKVAALYVAFTDAPPALLCAPSLPDREDGMGMPRRSSICVRLD